MKCVRRGSVQDQFSLLLGIFVFGAGLAGCKPPNFPEGCRPQDLASPTPKSEARVEFGAEFTITKESMREALFSNNISLLSGINQVHQAKNQLGVARGNLLPSLGLSQLLFTAGSPVFALAAVEMLLPFLAPSNWFSYFENVALWKAEIVALRALKLNLLASGLSLFTTLASDAGLLPIYEAEVTDLREIQVEVTEAHHAGLATKEELELATSQLHTAELSSRLVRELIGSEIAAIRHALAAPVSTDLKWETPAITESVLEAIAVAAGPIEPVVDQAVANGPEALQLEFLLKAAKLNKWKAVFSFISGASASGTPSSAFSDLAVGVSAGIGFGYVPSIRLTERNQIELDLRLRELRLESTEIVEATFEMHRSARDRLILAEAIEKSTHAYYDAKHAQYISGMDTLGVMLQARSKWRQASVKILEARAQIEQTRITLNRIALTGEFTGVDSCDLSALQ